MSIHTEHINTKMTIVSKPEGPAEGEDLRRRRKKRTARGSLACAAFLDHYKLTGERLGQGSYGRVETCTNIFTGQQAAVKIIAKVPGLFNRSRVLREIELYHLCRGQQTIVQLIEFFEEQETFFLVFERLAGGTLQSQIERRGKLGEEEAALVTRDLATALAHLHGLGVAHRDLKPDNVLCLGPAAPWPVKLCDFDLCSAPGQGGRLTSPVGSLEYMAPEVLRGFTVEEDDEEEVTYSLTCDLWSLGVLLFTLLSGSLPFTGHCRNPFCAWWQGGPCSTCRTSTIAAITCSPLVFPPGPWEGVSQPARALVSRLLGRRPEERMAAREVVALPWVTRGREEGSPRGGPARAQG